MIARKCKLIKIIFNVPLKKIKYNGFFSPGGISPGGALFRKSDVYHVDFRRRTIVLRPGFRIIGRFRPIIGFRSNTAMHFFSADLIKTVEIIEEYVAEELLCPQREDRVAFQIIISSEERPSANSFFSKFKKTGIILDMQEKKGTLDSPHTSGIVNTITYEILVKKRHAERLRQELLQNFLPQRKVYGVLAIFTSAKTLRDNL